MGKAKTENAIVGEIIFLFVLLMKRETLKIVFRECFHRLLFQVLCYFALTNLLTIMTAKGEFCRSLLTVKTLNKEEEGKEQKYDTTTCI